MSYESALKKFNSYRRKKVYNDSFSKHLKTRCLERFVNFNELKRILKYGVMVGFVHQGEQNYKVIFEWSSQKDLNIFVNLNNLKFKTLYLSKVEIRKREK